MRYNFTESCVFGLYTTSHATLLALPFNSLLFVVMDAQYITPMGMSGFALMALYAAVAGHSLVRPHGTPTLMTFLVFIGTYLLFSVLAGIVAIYVALFAL